MSANRESSSLEGRRVLLVFPAMELGGAERQGLHLARHFQAQGCDVRVWATHAGRGLAAEQCDAAGIPWAVHRFRWPCRKTSLLRDGWRFLRALRRERPDAILAYTTWPNVGCGLTWRWSSARICVWGQRNVNDLQGDAVERKAYRRVSAVICNAQHELEYLDRTLGSTPAPRVVIHNGTELAPPIRTRHQWRQDLNIDAAAPVATMVANFRPQKDHATLLQAWRRIVAATPRDRATPQLVLAGAPQTSYDAVRNLTAELGLLDGVHVVAQTPDVAGLLAASDVGILLSRHEGLANAVIEYMAAGLPVVATDLPGNREALGADPRQPLVKLADVDDVVMTLLPLLQTPGLREALGARNRRRAADEFSVATMCRRVSGVLCASGNARRGRVAAVA